MYFLYICELKKKLQIMDYAALIKNGKNFGVLSIENLTIEFLDHMFEMGYEFKRLTQKEYDKFCKTQELSF
jgi:hypothetical protein